MISIYDCALATVIVVSIHSIYSLIRVNPLGKDVPQKPHETMPAMVGFPSESLTTNGPPESPVHKPGTKERRDIIIPNDPLQALLMPIKKIPTSFRNN